MIRALTLLLTCQLAGNGVATSLIVPLLLRWL
jgi:hypothetical protein